MGFDKMRDVPSILVLGPTGSGKTPLGDLLEKTGLRGKRCRHFDFGENFRRAARGEFERVLSEKDLAVIRESLSTGTLLEDHDFGIALKILAYFTSGCAKDTDLLVMNGLPRHAGQAQALEKILNVRLVVLLDCDAETVRDRIAQNTGGDRTARVDDSAEMVAGKLKLYRERTLPLLEYYSQLGADVVVIKVNKEMKSEDVKAVLEEKAGYLLKTEDGRQKRT